MAYIDPWDDALEGATGVLDALSGGTAQGRGLVRTPSGWVGAFGANRKSVSVELAFVGEGERPRLDDYALVLLFGLAFRPAGDDPRSLRFHKTLNLREGYQWDEQTLREIVLESLGLMRNVLGARDEVGVFEDLTRPSRGLPFGSRRAARRHR